MLQAHPHSKQSRWWRIGYERDIVSTWGVGTVSLLKMVIAKIVKAPTVLAGIARIGQAMRMTMKTVGMRRA